MKRSRTSRNEAEPAGIKIFQNLYNIREGIFKLSKLCKNDGWILLHKMHLESFKHEQNILAGDKNGPE